MVAQRYGFAWLPTASCNSGQSGAPAEPSDHIDRKYSAWICRGDSILHGVADGINDDGRNTISAVTVTLRHVDA